MMITKLIVEQEQETEQALALLSSLTTILATAIKQYQVGTLLKNTARLASVVEWRCATQATTDNYITFAEQVDEIARLPTSKDGNMTISSYIMRSIACRAYAASEDIQTMRQRLDELLHTLEQWPFGYSDLLDLLATQMMPLLALWPSSHDIADGFQLATTAVLNAFETHNHSQIMETAYLIDTLLLCAKQRDQQVMAFEECLRWPMTLYPQHLPFALPA